MASQNESDSPEQNKPHDEIHEVNFMGFSSNEVKEAYKKYADTLQIWRRYNKDSTRTLIIGDDWSIFDPQKITPYLCMCILKCHWVIDKSWLKHSFDEKARLPIDTDDCYGWRLPVDFKPFKDYHMLRDIAEDSPAWKVRVNLCHYLSLPHVYIS